MTFICEPCDIPSKTCSKCLTEQPLSRFHKRKDRKNGYQSWCKACSNSATIASRKKDPTAHLKSVLKPYNLTVEAYKSKLEEQRGLCKICSGVCQTGRRLAVDHNHETGEVRGLLCQACNTGLGKFKDSQELLLQAVAYLKEYSG